MMSRLRIAVVGLAAASLGFFGNFGMVLAANEPIDLSEPLRIGPGSIGVDVAADGKTAYAVSEISSRLVRIDATAGSITHNIPVEIGAEKAPGGPRSVIIDDARNRVIVAGQSRPAVLIYDPVSLALVDEIVFPQFFGFSSAALGDDGELYLGMSPVSAGSKRQQGRIIKVDLASGAVLAQSPDVGTSVYSMTVDTTHSRAFFIGNAAKLQMWDMNTDGVRSLPASNGGLDTSSVLSSDSEKLYVSGTDGVRVLEASTLREVDTWATVPNASAVGLVEDQGVAYVVSWRRLHIVDLSSGTLIVATAQPRLTLGYGRYFATNGVLPTVAFVDGTSWVRTGTLQGLPPSAPRKVKARVKGSTAVVTWRPPTFSGEAVPIRYEVTTNAKGVSCTTSKRKCTLRNLKPGRTYKIRVQATSDDYASLPSKQVTVRLKKPSNSAPAVAPAPAEKPSQQPS